MNFYDADNLIGIIKSLKQSAIRKLRLRSLDTFGTTFTTKMSQRLSNRRNIVILIYKKQLLLNILYYFLLEKRL